MLRLRKIMSDSAKDMRHRRNLINIHITFLGWLVEFSGFFIMVLGSFFIGHSSVYITLLLQTINIIILFIILPCVYLINDSDLKENIVESKYYLTILQFFHCQWNSQNEVVDENEELNSQGQVDDRNKDDNK